MAAAVSPVRWRASPSWFQASEDFGLIAVALWRCGIAAANCDVELSAWPR